MLSSKLLLLQQEHLKAIPPSEAVYPEEEQLTYSDILAGLAQGKLLFPLDVEKRLYEAFGLTKPAQVFYPTVTWNSPKEAAEQKIFCSDAVGVRIECHCLGQQICEMLGLGNPGARFTDRSFRGRAYAKALRGWVLRRLEEERKATLSDLASRLLEAIWSFFDGLLDGNGDTTAGLSVFAMLLDGQFASREVLEAAVQELVARGFLAVDDPHSVWVITPRTSIVDP